jgi:hypothetical protein
MGRDIKRIRGHIDTKTELNFAKVKLTKQCLSFMAELTKHNSWLLKLNKLTMENKQHFIAARSGIQEYELEFLQQRMKANRFTIQSIDLSSNILKASACHILSKTLNPMPALLKLNLNYNCIGAEGAYVLARSLEIGDSLQELYINYNGLGDNGANEIAHALRLNNVLKVLEMAGNEITDIGGKSIIYMLQESQSLTSLNLRWNNLTSESIVDFGTALMFNKSLTELDIGQNNCGVKGAVAIAKALTENNSLTKLNMCGDITRREQIKGMEEEGGVAIGEMLLHNKSIKILDISETCFGPLGAKSIGEALKFNTTLTTLNCACYYEFMRDAEDERKKLDLRKKQKERKEEAIKKRLHEEKEKREKEVEELKLLAEKKLLEASLDLGNLSIYLYGIYKL